MKKCIVCGELKDEWQSFTRTDKDEPYEVDVCQLCRLKQFGGKI